MMSGEPITISSVNFVRTDAVEIVLMHGGYLWLQV